jgi:hypothetical protein
VFQLILPFQLDLPFEPASEETAGPAECVPSESKNKVRAPRVRRPPVRGRGGSLVLREEPVCGTSIPVVEALLARTAAGFDAQK